MDEFGIEPDWGTFGGPAFLQNVRSLLLNHVPATMFVEEVRPCLESHGYRFSRRQWVVILNAHCEDLILADWRMRLRVRANGSGQL